MTAHQRRPGFRLPWSSETETGDAGSTDAEGQSAGAAADPWAPRTDAPADAGSADEMGDHAATTAAAADDDQTADATGKATADAPQTMTHPTPEAQMPATTAQPTTPADEATPATGFLGDLVAAMRRVADEARESTLSELRSRVDEAIREREAAAERRRNELRSKAEADIAGVGDWAKSEAERIKADAEQRVAARRAQLDQQLAAETSQVESAADALRSRIAAYERELETYHEQLAATNDPAAFATAAKRMPPPPALDASAAAPAVPAARPAPEPEPEPPAVSQAEEAPGTNGSAPAAPVDDVEGAEVPATDLDELDATPEPAAAAAAPETYAEPVATEIVVKGLGSFGAITGFRQQLANVEGIDAVGLSLGTSGEFVFRATHRPSVDMAAAITTLEGDAVEIEPRAEGGLRVTLGRPR